MKNCFFEKIVLFSVNVDQKKLIKQQFPLIPKSHSSCSTMSRSPYVFVQGRKNMPYYIEECRQFQRVV